jgi:hypothetical protein
VYNNKYKAKGDDCMTTTTENFDKVYEYIRENHIWDDIYMDIADDHDENTYFIMDSWSEVDKLGEVVRQVLGIDKDEKIYIDELLGVEVVFSDEYTTCSDCHSVIRTSPDSYSWQPDFMWGDGYIACNKCFNDNEDYQEAYIEDKINDPKTAINGLITEAQMEELGFTKLNDASYENGYHRGQTDDPEAIYDSIKNDYDEVVFFIDRTGQFDIHFSVWVRGEVEGD